ncbi:unnamed protein product [Rodentolepis nana]|uniref:Fibronectin type-III domain-containing protein n=1 Tax=Rodentolepis nana TaxID=102285 RepID=A0A0R3T8U1_RODNA|nr:unnamed protein product [Rodentolepis nana]
MHSPNFLTSCPPLSDRCPCSPNAAYNTTNPRLPPFPEPCELQPEARLRPRMPSHSTASGYTAAALNAATVAPIASYQVCQMPGRAPKPTCMAALRMAASFQSPICHVPHPQCSWPSTSSTSTGSQTKCQDGRASRYAKSLFVLTWDMHLVEYELVVTPSESSDKVGQILDVSIPARWYRIVLLAINVRTKRLWLCPSPCKERVNEVSYQRTLPLVEDLPLEILKNIPKAPNTTQFEETISSKDYLVITIAAETSRISVHSEGEPTSFFNLLAAIGGLFGLYLGLSLVTVFECIESYYILLSEGFGTFRHAFKSWKRFGRKLLTREKSPEYDDEYEADANRLIRWVV